MATLSPHLLLPLRTDAGLYRELEVLERLRDYLPAGFEVFHNIALHTLHTLRRGRDAYGEIDIAVLSPAGCLLLMEVKAGSVVLRNGEIFKLYADSECDVARQGRLQRVAMQNRLQESGLETSVTSCLVLPDYDLGDSQVISIPSDRIIDAPRYDGLVSTVQGWLANAQGQADREGLRRLLLNQFRVTPDLQVMRDQLQGAVRRLADGLATWVPRIEALSGVFRIDATAGSGKIQLALQLLDGAAAEGLNAGYVCFNRSKNDLSDKALMALKLMLCAWARLEDETQNAQMKQRYVDFRDGWGRLTRDFLSVVYDD